MNFEKLTNSFWKLQIIGWLIYFVLMFLSFISQNFYETWLEVLFIKIQRSFAGFVLTSILYFFYRNIVNRYPIGKNVAIAAVASVLFGIIWTILETVYFWAIFPEYNVIDSLPRKPRIALIYAVTIMAWSAIYFGVEYWKQLQEEKENALEAKVLAEKAQLEMLRYQVNPHFLFNAMNSIRASINSDNKPAKQMITQLSEFLRHSLLSNQTDKIPLRDEIEAIENYLAIEKIRFEETLEVEFDVDEKAKDFKVPCFLLNPLVENAVKHGFITSSEVLKINISAKQTAGTLIIEVSNTGKLDKDQSLNGTKIGLKNVRERLKKLFADKASFELFEENEFVIARIKISE